MNNSEAFLALVRAGLWEGDNVNLDLEKKIGWEEVYRLAMEQSMLGLVLAGVERYKDVYARLAIPFGLSKNLNLNQEVLLQWIGDVQMLEQQNKAMNEFIAELIEKMRNADIYTLLVKGQGIAQCYDRPLWRACGDVDLLLSDSNYERAKEFLIPLAKHVDPEEKKMKHLGMTIGDWIVELHGTMHVEMSRRVNKVIDEVQDACFKKDGVRSWNNVGTNILLPSPDNDIILVFTHILEHFFVEGVGLKQVCDWCRLLWIYRSDLDLQLLESRIRKMGLMTEWRAFGALAVDALGMPKEAMPFYDARYKSKGVRVLERILKSGNMGHNNDLSYREKYSGLTYKIVALWRRIKDFAGFTMIFPIDAPRFFVHYVFRKI